MHLWIKRAIGAAVLGGGLLAATAGAAGAQEVSADVSARLGRPTSADVRVCADGRLLSRLVGSCNSPGTTADAQADRAGGVRVPRLASADVSTGTRRSRPQATVSADASAATWSRAATADADASAAASLSRPRAGALLDLDATASLAGVGLLANLVSGNQVDAGIASVSPSVPVTVCRNGVGALGDASAACGTAQSSGSGGPTSTPSGGSDDQSTVSTGGISPSVPVTVCGNSVGLLGDASVACAADTSTGGITARRRGPPTRAARPTPTAPPARPGRPAPPASPDLRADPGHRR